MDILNSYAITDESSWQAYLVLLLVFPVAISGVFATVNLLLLFFNHTTKRLLITLTFLTIAVVSISGLAYCLRSTPMLQRHEILWRDQSQSFQIDPQKYRFIEQRNSIIVIEEIEPVCTRGEYNGSPKR